MTYIVMEIKTSYAVILDEDGKFYYAANMNYQVGEKIENPFILNVDEKIEKHTLISYIYKLLPATLVLCLIFGFNIYNSSVLASFILKINPEVKITIDHKNHVKNIIANNNDGFYLIQNYDYNQKNYKIVTEELINRAMELGYLNENGTVSIKMMTSGMEELGNELNLALDHSLKNDYNIEIHIYTYEDELEDLDELDDEINNIEYEKADENEIDEDQVENEIEDNVDDINKDD